MDSKARDAQKGSQSLSLRAPPSNVLLRSPAESRARLLHLQAATVELLLLMSPRVHRLFSSRFPKPSNTRLRVHWLNRFGRGTSGNGSSGNRKSRWTEPPTYTAYTLTQSWGSWAWLLITKTDGQSWGLDWNRHSQRHLQPWQLRTSQRKRDSAFRASWELRFEKMPPNFYAACDSELKCTWDFSEALVAASPPAPTLSHNTLLCVPLSFALVLRMSHDSSSVCSWAIGNASVSVFVGTGTLPLCLLPACAVHTRFLSPRQCISAVLLVNETLFFASFLFL